MREFPIEVVMEWGPIDAPQRRIIALAVDEEMATRIIEGLARTYGDHINAAFFSVWRGIDETERQETRP